MNKTIVCIMLLAFMLTGCFNSSQRKNEVEETSVANKPVAALSPTVTNKPTPLLTSTPDLKSPDNYADFKDIKLKTADNNLEQIGRSIFEMYLKSFTEAKVIDSARIGSYEIEDLKIIKGDINAFQFYIHYAIKPSTEKYILAGNGIKEPDGWIRRRNVFVNLEKKSDGFIITGINTSP